MEIRLLLVSTHENNQAGRSGGPLDQDLGRIQGLSAQPAPPGDRLDSTVGPYPFASGSATLPGGIVRVYSPAKTVADCFKFRNKVGLDVALEALRETWRGRRATMDELNRFARACRVANVMRPYLESLT